MKIFKVEKDCSLKEFTTSVYPQGAFAFSRLISNRDIKVNGVRADKNTAVKAGDEVTYYTTAKEEQKKSHAVLYEDENVLICDKFYGVSVEGLTRELSENRPVYPAHRLDTNTQGVMAFALNESALDDLCAAFKDRLVRKEYLAYCKNGFKESEGRLTAYLKKNSDEGIVKIYPAPVAGGVKIATDYSVLQRMGDIALVKIILHTGKTHQIRAHMAYIGCPVLGDGKYGDKLLNSRHAAARQCLLAKRLSFEGLGKLSYLNGTVFESKLLLEVPK